jgi:prepilin-type N-terminal cleavage/methylation domain-containing protein
MMRLVRLPKGFVLIEMLMVIGIIGLMTLVATISFSAMWGNLKFKSQAEDLVNIFRMAQNAAATSDRRYEILLDLTDQSYILREFTEYELLTDESFDEDTIIQQKYFSDALTVDYILFDDIRPTDDTVAVAPEDEDTKTVVRFLAGKSGWQAGGIIVVLDEDGQPWTIVIHRFARPAELIKGEWDLISLGMLPQYKENIPF